MAVFGGSVNGKDIYNDFTYLISQKKTLDTFRNSFIFGQWMCKMLETIVANRESYRSLEKTDCCLLWKSDNSSIGLVSWRIWFVS